LPLVVLGKLSYLDPNMMKVTLVNMWQKDMNTNDDPADGKWYTTGPNNDGVGLYGNLTDVVDSTVHYDDSKKSFVITNFVADSATVDNTNGLNPTNTVTLSYQHKSTTSQSHTVSKSFNQQFNISYKASFTVFGISNDLSTSYSFDYSYSASETSSSSSSDSVTTSQTVPVTVPKGKIYKVLLTARGQQLILPTTCVVHVTGKTETWFKERVQGHYDWYMPVGSAFALINKYGSASAGDSNAYTADPTSADNGIYTTYGTITGANVADFAASVVDVTGLTAAQIQEFENNLNTIPAERVVQSMKL